jgi:hypothetical protein
MKNSIPITHLRRWLGLLVGVFSLSIVSHAVTPIDGEDWEFPYTVVPKQYSGLFSMDGSPSGLLKHRGVTLWWELCNPTEDSYDFSAIEDELDAAAAEGAMVAFRMKASIVHASPTEQNGMEQSVPQWVLDKYALENTDHVFNVGGSGKVYVAPWHPGVQQEFRKFLKEFGRRRLIEHPAFMGIYLHGISTSSGEEMAVNSSSATTAAALSATAVGYASLAAAIDDCWKKRMTWWKEAVGDYIYKVAWVGCGSWSNLTYDKNGLDDFALAVGMGKRHGLIERYYYEHVHPPFAGQSMVDHYVESDWTAALRDGRYWGDENEEYDEYKDPFGDGGNDDGDLLGKGKERDLAYRSSFFRAAQVGMNFLWTRSAISSNPNRHGAVQYASNNNPTGSSTVEDFDPDGPASVPLWFTRVAGKGPAESPDAAIWLREAEVRLIPGQPNPTTWKNFERLVMQRDILGANSQPSERYYMPYVSLKINSGNPDDFREYTARSTNIGANQRKLAFKLDSGFRESLGNQSVLIKVHFLDKTNNATWQVDVAKGTGTPITIGSVTESGDNKWKTATFTLSSADAPMQPDAAGMDFYIHKPGGSADVTVRYVRVVRTQAPSIPPAIKLPPVSQSIVLGQNTALSVIAAGSEPFTYQWKHNGTDVPGATGSALILNNVQPASTGAYTVTVTNAHGSVISTPAQVRLIDASLLIDSFNDGDASAPPWEGEAGSGALPTIVTSSASPQSPDGSYYANISFGNANTWKYASLKKGVFGDAWLARGTTGLQLYLKGNSAYSALPNNGLRLQIREGLTGERWSFDLGSFAKAGSWQTVNAPFSSFYLDSSGGSASGTTGVLDLDLIDQVRIYNHYHTSVITVAIDRLEVTGFAEMIDDFNDGDPAYAHFPYWRPQSGGSGNDPAVTLVNTAPTSPDGSHYARFTFNNAATWKYVTLNGGVAAFGGNWAVNGVDAIRFYIKGDDAYADLTSASLKFQLREGETGERWSFDIGNHCKVGSWQLVTVPISALYADGGNPSGTAGVLDLHLIDQLRFYNNSHTTPVTISVDGLVSVQ